MNELIGKKIHIGLKGLWYEVITEIVCHTETSLLVKIRADDGFEMYECFNKRNGEWYFFSYWHHSNRKTALYLFDLESKQKSA